MVEMVSSQLLMAAPSPFFTYYVHFYFQMLNAGPYEVHQTHRQHTLPTGHVFIGFVFNGDLRVRMHNGSGFLVNYPIFFSGQCDLFYALELPPNLELFAAVLHSSTARLLTNMPMDRPRNNAFEAHYHLCPKLKELHNKMATAPFKERAPLFERWLGNKLYPLSKDRVFTDWIATEIVKSKGLVRTNDLARKNGVSERHLQRTFKERIGLSPHKFATIVRMNHIVSDFNRSQLPLLDLLDNYGYYDKAHFRKQFKQLTGATFANYLGLQNGSNENFLKRITF